MEEGQKVQKGLKVAQHLLRTVPQETVGMEDLAEMVRREGFYCGSGLLRRSIIGGLEIRPKIPKGTKVENAVFIGCHCFGTALPLLSYCRVLQRLGIEYDFLPTEYCCGAPFVLRSAGKDGEERKQAEALSREFIGMNIEQAKRLGFKRMYYFCPWCAYLARRFYPDAEVGQHFYADIFLHTQQFKGVRLSKPAAIAYFQGGQHRRHFYVPGINWDFDWPGYRKLLDSVEGLEVTDLPHYCCVIAPDAIFDRARKHGLNTIVTPCTTCYGRLSRKAPQGFRVKQLPDLLLEVIALAQAPNILDNRGGS